MSKILYVVDVQNDFMKGDGKLSVPGAEAIIGPLSEFIQKLNHTEYSAVVFSRDTHTTEEGAAEGQGFPPHCMVGTDGWELAVDPDDVPSRIPIYFIDKGVFDVWKEPILYVTNHNGMKISNRDSLFNQFKDKGITDIDTVGVCSDICVKYFITGALNRGFNVNVISRFTKGLKQEIQEVITENFPTVTIS